MQMYIESHLSGRYCIAQYSCVYEICGYFQTLKPGMTYILVLKCVYVCVFYNVILFYTICTGGARVDC